MLKTPGFRLHALDYEDPRSGNLSGTTAPPTRRTDGWRVPAASRGQKIVDQVTNPEVPAYIYINPFQSGWEQAFAQGMPIFANSKSVAPGTAAILAGSPAVVNYYLEEGARVVHAAIANKRKRGGILVEYKAREHLYGHDASEIVEKWRPFGVISTMMGKKNESGFPGINSNGDLMILNCNVNKKTRVFNYWGNKIATGHRLYWQVIYKRNTLDHFYDPNGQVVGLSSQSPEFFFQLVPVSFGPYSASASHNRKWYDLENPHAEDLDYMQRNLSFDQQEMEIDPISGSFVPKPLDLRRETVKSEVLIDDIYTTGALIPAGVVNKGPRGKTNPSDRDLMLATRDNLKAQQLEQIEVFLSC